MTKDQATTVRVRVETAIHALREAIAHGAPAEGDQTAQEISDSLEEALQAAETAQAALVGIIGF